QTWLPNYNLNWNYPSWSISSEWFAYLCFPLICVTILRWITTRVRAHAFLAICWSATIAVYVFGREMLFRPLIQVIPTFLTGTAIFTCMNSVPRRLRYGSSLGTHHAPDFLLFSLIAFLLLFSGDWAVVLSLSGFLLLVYCLARQPHQCSKFWTNRVAVYLG